MRRLPCCGTAYSSCSKGTKMLQQSLAQALQTHLNSDVSTSDSVFSIQIRDIEASYMGVALSTRTFDTPSYTISK